MRSYIRPLSEGRLALRALMKSALPLLNNALASQAGSSFRVWGSRSDLSCHQLDHTSHRAVGFLHFLMSPSFWCHPFSCFCQAFYLLQPLTAHLACGSSHPCQLPAGHLCTALARVGPIDPTSTQQRPHNPRILVRHRDCRPMPPSTLEQPPNPLVAIVGFQLHPAQRRPCTVDQQLAHVARLVKILERSITGEDTI
jgi:hypothetical protein